MQNPHVSQNLPHRCRFQVPGLHGYTDLKIVAAGEAVRFHLSRDVECTLSVYQLGPDLEGRTADTVLHTFEPSPRACAFDPPQI